MGLTGQPCAGQASGQQAEQLPTEKRLTRASLEELGKMEVTTASKWPVELRQTPAAIFVITQEDIRRSGATTIPEALRLAPGVEVKRLDSNKWAIGVRGFGTRLSRSVLVLIDGRSVYTPLFAGVYWEVQDTLLEDIERIEVIRGPGGTVWGANAVNGVINIITKSAKDTHGVLTTAGGGNVEQGFAGIRYGGGTRKNIDYRIYAKFFTRAAQFHADSRLYDDWRMAQGGFRLDWTTTQGHTWTFQGDRYEGPAGNRLAISSYSPPSIANVDRNSHLSGGNVLARWRRPLRAGSHLQVQAYFDRTNRKESNFAEIRNTFDVDVTHQVELSRRHHLIWGLGARASSSDARQVVPTVLFTPRRFTDQLYTAYVQDEITLIQNRLAVTVGTKFLHNNYSGFEWQPSARLLWTLSPQQSIWGSVTRAVRTPSRVEEHLRFTALFLPSLPAFLRLTGDGRFSPEKILSYETGYRRLIGANFYVDVTAFFGDFDDFQSVEADLPFLEVSPSPPHIVLPILFRNGLVGKTAGLEIAPVWTPVERWRLQGSYSFLNIDMKNKPGSIDGSTAGMLEGSSPRHQVQVQSRLDLPKGLQFDQTLRYVSALPAQLVGDYVTADLRASWQPVHSFELSVVGQNLLQPYHFEFAGQQVGIKRSVYAKITLRP